MRIVGGLLLPLALAAAALAVLSVPHAGGTTRGTWYACLVLQGALTAVWAAWSGILLLRGAAWPAFRLPGTVAVAGGAIGLANLPRTVGPGATFEPRLFLILALVAVFAGLGHRAAAKGSPFATMLHTTAMLAPLLAIAVVLLR